MASVVSENYLLGLRPTTSHPTNYTSLYQQKLQESTELLTNFYLILQSLLQMAVLSPLLLT